MASFVLIHGGGHGAWCWDRVVPALKWYGHQVRTPDLPSLGEDRTPIAEVTAAACASRAVQAAEEGDEKVFLVGHSLGGCVIGDAAEQISQKIAGLIYLTAALVPPGATFNQLVRDNELRPEGMRLSEDGLSTIVGPTAAPRIFYNRTDPSIATERCRSASAQSQCPG